ncbi:MAG TPA: ABC transporter substrate-binding protein [Methylomirabilota bacterium]|nr:ABC transporter substrate-binding protein [Methylomirabilota bacterium]
MTLRSVVGALLLFGVLSPAGASNHELVVGRAVSTTSMDPGFLREPATIVDNIFDTLVLRDKDMNLVPGLAESWRAVNATTWEFKLRRGVKFHNGEPFTGRAVKFTIDRVLDPAAKSPTISYIRTIQRVDVADDYTVQIVTSVPDPLVPTRMSRYPAYIVPPDYVAKVGVEEFGRKPVGTGPYKLASFVKDEQITLVANDEYWRGAPAIKRVVWRPIPEATARLAALLAGEVHIVENLPVDQVAVVERSGAAEVERVRSGGLVIYLGVKASVAPLDKPKVRQAISLAIDRRSIVESILRGYASLTGTQVGPFDFGYVKVDPPPFDPARARQLLAEAGHPNGFDIDLQVTRRYVSGAEVGQAIAQQLKNVGIRVNLQVPEWSVYIQQVPAGKQAPLYMLGWGSTQTLDADAAVYAIFRSGEPYSTISIPRMDQLLDEARRAIDPDARRKLYREIQELAAREVPVVTLYQEDALYGKRKNVRFKGRADARVPISDIRLE